MQVFLRSWWVIIIFLVCYLLYEHGMRSWENEYSLLRHRYIELEDEKQRLSAIQEDLLLQINSQSDPAWVELVLVKGLGLVPEGQIKFYFD